MQTLWSRVAQVRSSCGCPRCLSTTTTTAVSRRAAASATRQIPQYWTSSTLWYSGIFAAAATFDAGLKIQRREKWDLAIAEVREELGQKEENAQHEERGEDQTAQVNGFEGGHALSELEANLDSSSWREKEPRVPSHTGPNLDPGHLPPQSIYSPRKFKFRAELTQLSDRKLEVIQLSVDLLQLRLWHSLYANGWEKEAIDAVPAEYSDMFRMTPERLYEAAVQKRKHLAKYSYTASAKGSAVGVIERLPKDLRLCTYHQDDPIQSYADTHGLNTVIRDLFHRGQAKDLSVPAVLAKVYFNLSTSQAPPNVDTFNTLIVGLSKLRQDARVREVIAALRQTCIRPNEVTMTSILEFYTKIRDSRSFRYWVQVMRGQHGGLMLAQPGVRIGPSSQGRLVRSSDSAGRKPDKIIQLPHPTPMVFAALINGVLQFSGFDAALRICESMSRERWGVSINCLRPLLIDCANRRDWTSGLAVWNQIEALRKKSRMERGRRDSEVIDLSLFAVTLRLCRVCGKKDHFNLVYNAAIQAYPSDVSKLHRLLLSDTWQPQGADTKSAAPLLVSNSERAAADTFTSWLSKEDAEAILTGRFAPHRASYQAEAPIFTKPIRNNYHRHLLHETLRATHGGRLAHCTHPETKVMCIGPLSKIPHEYRQTKHRQQHFDFHTPWTDLAMEEGSTYRVPGKQVAKETADAPTVTEGPAFSADPQVIVTPDVARNPSNSQLELVENFEDIAERTGHTHSVAHRTTVRRRQHHKTMESLSSLQMNVHWDRHSAFEISHPTTFAF